MQETGYNQQSLDKNNVIKKKKSNFYYSLEKYNIIDKVTYSLTDNNKTIEKKQFIENRSRSLYLSQTNLNQKYKTM